MPDMLPTVMVRNEERFISAVLQPLAQVFGHVLLGDTGSTDETVPLAQRIAGVEIIEYGVADQIKLTEIRQDMSDRVAYAGQQWQLLCDGDELYHIQALRWLKQAILPSIVRTGFTCMVTLDEDAETGALYELDDVFSRQALLPVPTRYVGTYPFDVPSSFGQPEGFYYFTLPEGLRYHAVHLHRLRRSSQDERVILRRHKQYQFSMQDKTVPRARSFDLNAWCSHE